MRTLVFVCPITGHPVQSSLPEEAFKDPDTYHPKSMSSPIGGGHLQP